MIIWAHAVLGVLYACVIHFCFCTCSVLLSMFHVERCSRNTIIIIFIVAVGILAKARGLAILTVFKAGFLVTARGGSGIVIARVSDELDYSEGEGR